MMDAWDHPTSGTSGQVGQVDKWVGFIIIALLVMGLHQESHCLGPSVLLHRQIQFNSLVKVLLSLNF